MLAPKKTKYRKAFKGRISGVATAGIDLVHGSYGLKALGAERITGRQIEAARRAMSRSAKRGGSIWTTIFPDIPVSAKAAETRMGSGKGNVDHWVCRVRPGRIMFELDGVTEEVAKEACKLAGAKLPIKTAFVKRIV